MVKISVTKNGVEVGIPEGIFKDCYRVKQVFELFDKYFPPTWFSDIIDKVNSEPQQLQPVARLSEKEKPEFIKITVIDDPEKPHQMILPTERINGFSKDQGGRTYVMLSHQNSSTCVKETIEEIWEMLRPEFADLQG